MNAVEFCAMVEGRLGWEMPQDRPRWLVLRQEAGKVLKRQAEDPTRYTWDNLVLAVNLLAREKKSRTPTGVFAHVDRALDLALDTETDVEAEIRQVVAYETKMGDPLGWAVRFARADGYYRRLLLIEWREGVR